jgi:NAD(P)-dependent dehydrogenase (short-subunit alcohol dehydrogenase family)
MPRLDGKVAVVTGAAAGPKAALGAIFAKALAAEGAKVVLADTKDCASVAAAIAAEGGTAHAVLADVRDAKSVGAMIAEAERKFGRLDILVNNAAIGSNIPPIAIEEIDTALWDEFMTVNVRGTFLCVKAAIPAMRRNNYGKIINLSSTTMLSGLSHRLHYVHQRRHRRDDALDGARARRLRHPGEFAGARTGDERFRRGGNGRPAGPA